ncbi:unnamed protein product [Microthlaspi erraticum]|uniref:SAP30-binding protein n=1 Tax=Microthlaspi erraticum TaxID=1685480 RepID=A0A6D2J0R1_9BRAS|nr:unnamed protein product [Microthlaspi erraticum]
MAPKKKHSEGIALLSVYSDEDDEEMEDADEEEEEEEEQRHHEESERIDVDQLEETNFMDEDRGRGEASRTPRDGGGASSAHDTPRSPDNDDSSGPDWSNRVNTEGTADGERADDASGESRDSLLDQFLPPRPTEKCSEDLQRKIDKFLSLKKMGKSFNNEVRNRKEYRNPDFLLHAVSYQDIDQTGSCFSKEVFDPNGYDPSDFCDAIEVDMKNERERKEQESKKSQKLDFVSVGTQQPGTVYAAQKPNIPTIPGIPALATSVLPSIPAEIAARPNKKSKWDKVDGDVKNPPPLPAGTQESLSSIRSNVSASASAGSGYSAFAQQRRREVEGRKSAERKLERRS